MTLRDRIKDGILLLDGALGTMLQARGLKTGDCPETLNVTSPETVAEIHCAYYAAGSDMVYTNTFGANERKLPKGYTPESVIRAAVSIAKGEAVRAGGKYVALDIGPIGELLEPLGTLSFDEAYRIFARQAAVGAESGADCVVIETMTDLNEMRAALLAVKENTSLPVICTMSFEENGRTFTGTDAAAAAIVIEGLGADAVGINCSLGPDKILPICERMAAYTDLPIAVKANAGLPRPDGSYDVGAQEFAGVYGKFLDMGVGIIGGCCGTAPSYIEALDRLRHGRTRAARPRSALPTVCSAHKVVNIDGVRVIGERINPTGKKVLKQALRDGDTGYILKQAVEQQEAGADILDINVGLPDIDEPRTMRETVCAVQSVVDLPLQIDSSDPEAVEQGLRYFCGKAIVNSVNGDDASLDSVLPLVKKYGAAVVGLTLDKDGIPTTAEGRLAIARKILGRARRYGIADRDVYIDCLTLTVSAEQKQAAETLRAIKAVKEELGLKTVLGVSNISFGLPMREIINAAFLSEALAAGLDLPIINPNVPSMMSAVRAHNVITGSDVNCEEYVRRYSMAVQAEGPKEGGETTLLYAVSKGLAQETAGITRRLIAESSPLEVIDAHLIPALDEIGARYERGEIFLPQLILAAETAQVGFDEIKKALTASSSSYEEKGLIVLATVEGDIHDIGKNMVKVVLMNFGYKVLDLGRNVPVQAVVNAVRDTGARLVGLSALMTTTVKNMERTINALKSADPGTRVMVGGAVLTESYARSIGADYYCRDVNDSVRAAKEVFGK